MRINFAQEMKTRFQHANGETVASASERCSRRQQRQLIQLYQSKRKRIPSSHARHCSAVYAIRRLANVTCALFKSSDPYLNMFYMKFDQIKCSNAFSARESKSEHYANIKKAPVFGHAWDIYIRQGYTFGLTVCE